MSDTRTDTPKIRFSGFTEDWEQRKFETLLDKNAGIRRGPFGSALKKEFFVTKSEYVVYEQQNAIYDNYETRYKISEEKFQELEKFELKPDDFIMSGAGTIGRISKVPKGINKGVFNQALIRFRLNKSITDSEFFIQFVRADFMQRKLTGANPGSAITNLVPMSEVKNWVIKVPNLKEQQKIGTFFKQLDDTIALHQRELDLLKQTKQTYLQKMFPKSGENKPEIRFAGFTDAWEQRKLGDITKISTGKLDANAMVENGKYDFYTSGTKKYRIDVPAFKGPAITIAGNGATVGYMHLADNKFNAYQRTYVLQEFVVDRSFLFSEVGNKLPKKINQEARTGNIPYIVMDMLTELKLSIPQDEAEQSKIGTFFKQLDDTITLHQRKLDSLKEMKKSLLQQMFV